MTYQWRFDVAWEGLPTILEGLGLTILLAVLAMLCGLIGGLVLALMRLSGFRLLAIPATIVVETFRTTPLIVQVVWVYAVLPIMTGFALSPFVSGLVALGFNVAAFMSEIYRAGIASIPRGQSQAALALGLTPAQAMRRIILPQAVLRMVPPMASIWVSLFKDTSIVTAIGVAEMMTQARALAADTYRPLEIYTLVALLYFALTLPQSMLVNWLFGRWRVRA